MENDGLLKESFKGRDEERKKPATADRIILGGAGPSSSGPGPLFEGWRAGLSPGRAQGQQRKGRSRPGFGQCCGRFRESYQA